jgi:hypothetical protein
MLEIKDTMISQWLIVRMCTVLLQTKSEGIRLEITSTLADVLRMWKEANPKSWNDLRKCVEMIKSYLSCNLLSLSLLRNSDSSRFGF